MSTWSLDICLVPKKYGHLKNSPKSYETFLYEGSFDKKYNYKFLNKLIEKAKNDISTDKIENEPVAWIQFSFYKNGYNENDPDWSHSHEFKSQTKVWRVKKVNEALDIFREKILEKYD